MRIGSPIVFLAVVIPLFALYLATATTSLPYHNDALTNVFAAWNIGTKGTPVLDEYEPLVERRQQIGWVVDSPRGPVSQYPPGAALLASPLYAVVADAPVIELRNANPASGIPPVYVPMPSLWPAAIVAAGTTAAAMGLFALTTSVLGATSRVAITAGYVGGLATSAWSVASDAFWQHGPGMLWIALAGWFLSRRRWGSAGLAYSMALLTRPPIVLIGVAVGVWLVSRARWREAGRLLLGATPGAIALLAYNWWLFGNLNVSGGYGVGFTENALEANLGDYFVNIGMGLGHPRYGLFTFTPLILVLLLASGRAARNIPPWAVVTAVGSAVVLLVQWKANRASGGGDYFFYRYPLEPLIGAAPFLYVAWRELWLVGAAARIAMVGTTTWSVIIHAYVVWRYR